MATVAPASGANAGKLSATATGTAGVLALLIPIFYRRWLVPKGWPELVVVGQDGSVVDLWPGVAVGLLAILHKMVARWELWSDRRFLLRALAEGAVLLPPPADVPTPSVPAAPVVGP